VTFDDVAGQMTLFYPSEQRWAMRSVGECPLPVCASAGRDT
jgi:hypothetical protein